MKGIAHFITGVAIATFFPEVVRQAAEGSLLPVLGGIAGILPDTLDFKFARYFERYDLEIDPGPQPDARDIAERVVGAMRQAYETGRPQNVALHTIRLGADLWRPCGWLAGARGPPLALAGDGRRYLDRSRVAGIGAGRHPRGRGCLSAQAVQTGGGAAGRARGAGTAEESARPGGGRGGA